MVVLFHSGFFRANHCLSEIRDAFVSATPAKGWDEGADKEKKEELAFFLFFPLLFVWYSGSVSGIQ